MRRILLFLTTVITCNFQCALHAQQASWQDHKFAAHGCDFVSQYQLHQNRYLIDATKNGDSEAVGRFLLAGASMTFKDDAGKTVVDYAEQYPDVVEVCKERKKALNQQLLKLASKHGHKKMVKKLLEEGADVFASKDGWTALRLAIAVDNDEIILLLAEHASKDSRLSIDGKSIASEERRSVILLFGTESILHDTCTDESHCTSGFGFCWNPEFEDLMEPYFSWFINKLEKQTALNRQLFIASREGNIEQVRVLLEQGVDADGRTLRGNTPLMVAVLHGRKEIVKLLLEAGADAFALNNVSWTAMHIAVVLGRAEIVRIIDDYTRDHSEPRIDGIRVSIGSIRRALLLFGPSSMIRDGACIHSGPHSEHCEFFCWSPAFKVIGPRYAQKLSDIVGPSKMPAGKPAK